MAKAGRPPRDPEAGPKKIFPLLLSDSEREELVRAAERAKLSTSEWMRERLSKAAKRESKRD